MNQKREQILAALKKLGPSSPTAIANSTSISPSLTGYHLRALLKDHQVKASGRSNDRVYALPDQKLDGAPPQERKQKKGGKRKAGKKAGTPRTRAAAVSAFLPAVDADRNLVLINGAAITRYNDEQTAAIATLLSQHYEA